MSAAALKASCILHMHAFIRPCLRKEICNDQELIQLSDIQSSLPNG